MKTKIITFYRTAYNGRMIEEFIRVSSSPFPDEGVVVSIPLVNLHRKDINDFIDALNKAKSIAGKLEED